MTQGLDDLRLDATRASTNRRVAGLVAGLMLAATSAMAASENTAISDDGTEVAAPNYAASIRGVSGSQGTGTGKARTAPESRAELDRMMNAKPASAPTGTETIIGADSRFLINPTTSYPNRAVVLITFDPPGPGTSRCTGWMIGKDTVATAGHCVAKAAGAFYDRTTYKIYPGRNGASSPYGFCMARRLHSVLGWTRDGSELYDYGAIKLDCNIGSTVGWFGMWWQTASMTGLFSRVSGYPGDKPLTQWQSTDSIRATQTNQLFYQNDTVGGNSGGPVWQNRGSSASFCQGVCAMAIHAYGLHGGAPHSTHNHGTRIREAVFNNLINWRNAP